MQLRRQEKCGLAPLPVRNCQHAPGRRFRFRSDRYRSLVGHAELIREFIWHCSAELQLTIKNREQRFGMHDAVSLVAGFRVLFR
jgi:hypothetical protein